MKKAGEEDKNKLAKEAREEQEKARQNEEKTAREKEQKAEQKPPANSRTKPVCFGWVHSPSLLTPGYTASQLISALGLASQITPYLTAELIYSLIACMVVIAVFCV